MDEKYIKYYISPAGLSAGLIRESDGMTFVWIDGVMRYWVSIEALIKEVGDKLNG